MNMFPILTNKYAEIASGWQGANPYGMVRLTLAEHVSLVWAQEADEYEAPNDGCDGYSAIVDLSPDDARFYDLCEHIDAAQLTTPEHPYPFGTWDYEGRDIPAGDINGWRWSMLIDVDGRGWPIAEVLPRKSAHERWDTFMAELPHDEDCDCDECDTDTMEDAR